MNPLDTLKRYLWLVCLAAIVTSYFIGHHKGFAERDLDLQVEIGKRNEAEREKEVQHTAKINDLATQLAQEKSNAKTANDKYRAAVRAGTERLYVNVRPVQTSPSAAPATGDRNETRAELDPTTAEELVGIANDGDDAIRQLNACIDAYNELRK